VRVRTIFRPLAALLCLLPTAPAQDQAAAEPGLEARIHRAIDRGTDSLLRTQQLDGSWRENQPGFSSGSTGLAVQTLLKCGVPPDPSLVRAMEYLRAVPPEKTYSVATNLIAYCQYGAEGDGGRIEELCARLLDTQDSGGGWAYPDGAVDLSNTQYAALALREAVKSGHVRVPKEVWLELAGVVLAHRRDLAGATARTGVPSAAGFGYAPNRDPTGSMTAAAVGVLSICAEQLGRLPREHEAARVQGLAWLGEHFAVDHNPNPVSKVPGVWHGEDAHTLYFLYGIERVAGLLDLERIGEHDWYERGATELVGRQDGTGLWLSNQANTCFALLFLSRATSRAATGTRAGAASKAWGFDDSGADVSVRAAGDAPTAVWISSFGPRLLEEVEWDGEAGAGPRVVRVDYFAAAEGTPLGDAERIGTVAGDPSRPAGKQRFALQHRFLRPGRWQVRADVTVLLPDGSLGEESSLEVVTARPLEIPIHYASEPYLLEYARDPARNLLAGRAVTARASSMFDEGSWRPEFAVENCRARAWLSANEDVAPWLEIEIGRRGVKASRLLLSHPEHQPPHLQARVRVVEVFVNGAKEGILVTMDPNPLRKTVVDLGRARMLRKLELRVREIAGGRESLLAVGFGEVELQLPR